MDNDMAFGTFACCRAITGQTALTLFPSHTEDAEALCANTGNEVISCFPTADVTIPQHELAYFVCTSYPSFADPIKP